MSDVECVLLVVGACALLVALWLLAGTPVVNPYDTDEGVWRQRIKDLRLAHANEHTLRVQAETDREQARGFCRLLHQRATQGLPVLPAVQLPEWMLPVPEPRETP